ncbi:hypothetical protein Acsp06_04910 [Actinomycetospora sp. NBRC 106375]|uniref:hypothetical protein n=1 Tax=Actinomycetospora sp. NBRC 106375 TaxID=3032207 RepID=UPI0024A2D738|nr:hypothetical protein [Actinomycetospora sp. NBRC 106375]GLZ44306.1 hypothetical protein Acsp06_04910 [Actinomycetospora sp. NBRC 106375]
MTAPTSAHSTDGTDTAEIVVEVPADPATLSCRLHGVIAGAGEGATLTVVVAAGERAAEPDLARVLTCARDAAAGRGLGFVVR